MTQGIHHITAIASNGKENVQFYSQILGLRLVKKTVNQDDTETYHLFFGDKLGHPGMDLTFFIFQPAVQGHRGNGLVTRISFVVPEDSLGFWEKRFDEYNVKREEIIERFGFKRLVFFDADDQQLELVGVPEFELGETSDLWTEEVGKEYAIRCFFSATLSVISHAMIDPVLTTVFGYELLSNEGQTYLYRLQGVTRAAFLEVHEQPSTSPGFNAAGTVHHIAFRARDDQEQLLMREQVTRLGLYPTEVINRFYFKSVYFRTPAGILFEIATDGPGFTADEPEESLGTQLSLPPFLEDSRAEIEQHLPLL